MGVRPGASTTQSVIATGRVRQRRAAPTPSSLKRFVNEGRNSQESAGRTGTGRWDTRWQPRPAQARQVRARRLQERQ